MSVNIMPKEKTLHFELQELSSDEESIEWSQLIRTGNFDHAWFGKFEITEDILRTFKLNFDRNARRVDIAVDYFHANDEEAAGWIKEIELRESDTELWIKVDWTPKAREKILDKEIRYLSAEFDLDYVDSETKKEYGAVLFGAGLTNRPHVRGMNPVFSDKTKKQNVNNDNNGVPTMTVSFEQIVEAIGSLTEDQKTQLGEKLGFSVKASDVAKLSEDKNAAEKALTEKDAKIKQLSEDVSDLKAKFTGSEKTIKFNELLTNGKVVEAQRDAYMKGDMAAFAENAVDINLNANGSDSDGDTELKGDDARIKFDELVNAKVKNGIALSEAAKQVNEENPKLAEAVRK